MNINLEQLCKQTISIAKEAGEFIAAEKKKFKISDIEVKSRNSLVSYVDKGSEKMIIDALTKLLPDCSFLAEEETVQRSENEWEWIIDPLDGTTNFMHGIPSYAVSIALTHKGESVMGVVYEINLDECFYAWKGGGAFLDGEKILVSPMNDFAESFISTGMPYYDFTVTKYYTDTLNELLPIVRGVRRLGAAAVDLCYVACGRYEAFFEHSLAPWDVAAATLIIKEAGGTITDFNGDDDYIFGRQIIAGNSTIHPEILNIVQKHFKDFLVAH